MKKVQMGDTVIVRTSSQFNRSNFHPGVVTAVHTVGEKTCYVNLKVLPDCSTPYDETSITVHATQAEGEASVSPTRFAFQRSE